MKKIFALLLAALLVLSFAACGKTAVSEPNDVSSEQPETPVVSEPSEPEAPSTSVPEEPEAPTVFNPEDLPRPNEISEENMKAIWTDEAIEYATSMGFFMSDEEAALSAELSDTLNQHIQIAEDAVIFTEEEVIALETALIEAYETSNTPQGKLLFSQMCSMYFLRYRDYESAIYYGEASLDELWADGEWLEKFRQGESEIDVLYMDFVYNAYIFTADLYIQYGDPQKALEYYYGIFGAYNQAELPITRSNMEFALEMALSGVQSLLDPSYLAGLEDDLAYWQDYLADALAGSEVEYGDASWAQDVVADMEADLARAQEAVAIAPELIAMIEADIEEYAA